MFAKPVTPVEEQVQSEARQQDEQVGKEQQAACDELVVRKIGESHQERCDREEYKQTVGTHLEVQCQRICLAVLRVDTVQPRPGVRWQRNITRQ